MERNEGDVRRGRPVNVRRACSACVLGTLTSNVAQIRFDSTDDMYSRHGNVCLYIGYRISSLPSSSSLS